eukprot:459336-Lingulodinium_polyedra.AAC.1
MVQARRAANPQADPKQPSSKPHAKQSAPNSPKLCACMGTSSMFSGARRSRRATSTKMAVVPHFCNRRPTDGRPTVDRRSIDGRTTVGRPSIDR